MYNESDYKKLSGLIIEVHIRMYRKYGKSLLSQEHVYKTFCNINYYDDGVLY